MKTKAVLILFAGILISCGGSKQSDFPMEKRFWNAEDYDNVIFKIRYQTPEGQRFPEFSNPETSPIIKKLVDTQNFLVVLSDEQLGLNHRNKVANDFFSEWKDLSDAYRLMDRQDKFLYGMELIEISKFGLELQIHYFKLGNDNILKEADDPNNSEVKRVIASNEEIIFRNYNNYLDFVNNENSFSPEELIAYSEGIDMYFPKLFEAFPNGNFKITESKANLMLNKAKNENVVRSLSSLLERITSKQ